MRSLPNNLHVIPGVELSTTLDNAELHILGYYIDHTNEALVAHAETALLKRAERIRQMIQLLARHKVHITYDDVLAEDDSHTGMLGRPHVARALQRKGYVQTVSEAFDRFLGDNGPCFLPTELLHPRAAIEMIGNAGGVAVWAHPRMDVFERLLPSLKGWGLRGLECIRPRAQPSEIQFFEETAKQQQMLVTGGSDWHGTWHGRLGDFYIRPDEIAAFLDVGGL